MGIVNVTPDSFSDGGKLLDVDRARAHAARLRADGADIIDIGGESTRPGARPVSADEELQRVLPVVEAVRQDGGGPVSVDTTKAEVAEAALQAGAAVINDISGGDFAPELLAAVARHGATVVLGHTRGRPSTMQTGDLAYEGGVVEAVRRHLAEAAARAQAAGVPAGCIWLDPGIGFGKTVAQNLALLRGLPRLRSLGHPVLVGTSRKSFLGELTGRPVEARAHATTASVAMSVTYGADMVRVHDVAAARDAVRVADACVREGVG